MSKCRNVRSDPVSRSWSSGQNSRVLLHAGVVAEAHPRDKLERLCRYVGLSGNKKKDSMADSLQTNIPDTSI